MRASESDGVVLLCCSACEDVLRGVEGNVRRCACGRSQIELRHSGRVIASPDDARLLLIPWEQFDGARAGDRGTWTVLRSGNKHEARQESTDGIEENEAVEG